LKYASFVIALAFCMPVATASAAANAQEKENSEARLHVDSFLNAIGDSYAEGLPGKSLQSKIRPFLSKSFSQLLKDVDERQVECIKITGKIDDDINKNKPENEPASSTKPPLMEGAIFTSNNEAPQKYRTIKSTPISRSQSRVTIEYTYIDSSGRQPYVWQNDALLIQENGHWKINDFLSIPQADDTDRKSYSVRSQLTEFPSCKNYFSDYEKNNSH
jgi:hypothetical protein